jgi:hypothetical protein
MDRPPLRCAVQDGEDVLQDLLGGVIVLAAKPRTDGLCDLTVGCHELTSRATVRRSASRAARMARIAWWSREWAVPTGIAQISAT